MALSAMILNELFYNKKVMNLVSVTYATAAETDRHVVVLTLLE